MHRQGLALAACPGLGPRRTPTCCSDSAALPCCAYSVHTARIKNGDRQRVPVPGASCPCRGKACQKPAFWFLCPPAYAQAGTGTCCLSRFGTAAHDNMLLCLGSAGMLRAFGAYSADESRVDAASASPRGFASMSG